MTGQGVRKLPFSTGCYPVSCTECGAGNLNEYFTSRALGLQLCEPCFRSRVKRGLAKEE